MILRDNRELETENDSDCDDMPELEDDGVKYLTRLPLARLPLFSPCPPGTPGPRLQGIPSFVNNEVRLLKHDNSIVREDHLDRRWEEATGEVVDEVIFLSRHTAVSNRPALTIHPIGVPHLQEGDVLPAGGKPGWAAPPNPRIGPWLRLLKGIAESHNLTPEFEVTLEATHHGPKLTHPQCFVEIGSTEEYWKRQDAAQAIALLVWEGLGLGGRASAVGDWRR
ncbi:D-aminoacyl-tRNA deacylase [Abeliophyllum distichum]|uniref:D-aminoacyl-tRNA deacylase n=1 Tax=Abeliophyllum distichum TaxID=126358 RepID=A0ABD1NU40_9LAMI